MAFLEKLKDILDKGVESSKGALNKAGTAAKTFGDTSVLKIEIQQLKAKRKKAEEELGSYALKKFLEGSENISYEEQSVKDIIEQVKKIDSTIEEKKQELAKIQKEQEEKRQSKQKDSQESKKENLPEIEESELKPESESKDSDSGFNSSI